VFAGDGSADRDAQFQYLAAHLFGTLQRCAEFGAMHVHHGKPSFPELERF